MTEPATATVKTVEERKAILAQVIVDHVAHGERVESQSDYQAVLVKGKKVNHILHLILTILTAGLWAIVWIILAVKNHQTRMIVTVDEYGRTSGVAG